jgi:hypothetical protein
MVSWPEMQSIGAFFIALVVGWLTELIVFPNTLTSQAANLRVIASILVAAAAGLLLLGATTSQLLPAGFGLATGFAGCAVMRYVAKMHSTH